MRKTTHEEKLEKKRDWYHKNIEKVKIQAKKSREKHKEKRKLEAKIWVENNQERKKEYQRKYHREWYQRNKATKDVQNKNWAKNNSEKVQVIKDRHKSLHPEKVPEYLSKYIKTEKGMFRTLKGGGVKRNYEVQITFEEFCTLISKPCTYCGEDQKRIGVDRIDNTQGYLLTNCTSCCTDCNMMKRDRTVSDFLEHIRKIHNHNY